MFAIGGAIKIGGSESLCYISECVFDGNYSHGMGGAISSDTDSTSVVSCTFVGNSSAEGYAGSVFVSASPFTMYNSILAFNVGYGVAYASNDLYIECTDAYGNSHGDWTEFLEPFEDINGNFSLNPLFCDTADGDYTLSENSFCIPEKSPCALLIGAHGVGCDALCGDVNADGAVDIDDPVYLVTFVFSFGPAPIPLSVGDCDCSGGDIPVDIDDIVHLLDYILRGGPEPCDADGDGVPDC
jgi:predicted outer membrane repeat protein